MSWKQPILRTLFFLAWPFIVVAALGISSSNPLGGQVPINGIILWDLSSTCPTHYAESTDMRGFYPVGMPAGGTVLTQIGTGLSVNENRPAGAHTHGTTIYDESGGSSFPGAAVACGGSCGNQFITDNGGLVAGTNAPHKYVLFCVRFN